MKSNELASEEADRDLEADDLFKMANLFPATTGLPMTVWVSPRAGARHDIRVKVHVTHGNRMNPTNTAAVGVHPSPHLISGSLSPEDQGAVFEWISRNTAALVKYWDGEIDTIQLGRALHALRKRPPRRPAAKRPVTR